MPVLFFLAGRFAGRFAGRSPDRGDFCGLVIFDRCCDRRLCWWRRLKHLCQISSRVRCFNSRDNFGRTLCDYRSATVAALRSKINYPVGCLDHIQVVFNHQDGVALVNQTCENDQESSDIFKVETSCWFIEQINRVTCASL